MPLRFSLRFQNYGSIIPPEQVSTWRKIMSKINGINIEADDHARRNILYRPIGHGMFQKNNYKIILLKERP